MRPRLDSTSGSSTWDVLMELLSAKAVTAQMLEKSVREHPPLVTPETQTLLSIIAGAQSSPDARAQVESLARILARLRTETMQAVVADEASRARRQSAARAREERLQAARDSFLSWRQEAPPRSVDSRPSHSLPSLSDVMTCLRSISVAERPRAYGCDVMNPQSAKDCIPAYLFRGESGPYATTCSSLARLRLDPRVTPRAIKDVGRVREFLLAAFEEKWGLSSEQAQGYLQHYGYPTDFIDMTSSPEVAVSFASSLRVGDEGAVCVVPTANLLPGINLIDLRHHPVAYRPRRQSAFAAHIPEYPDLKATDAVEALGLTWIPFRLTEPDAARFLPRFELLDARSDPVAGLIWLLITDFGKFDDVAASLLVNRIDPAPVYGVAGSDGKMVMVSEDDVVPEQAISDETFRRSHHEIWSDAFAPIERKSPPPELERTLRTDPLEPGSVIRILTTRAIASRVT